MLKRHCRQNVGTQSCGAPLLAVTSAEGRAVVMAARVLPWLYLGGKKEAKDLDALKRLGIKRVLNVTPCVGRLPPWRVYSSVVCPSVSHSHT